MSTLLNLPASSTMTQIAAIQRGLPGSALGTIAKTLGLSKQRIISALSFVPRTITERERRGRRFSAEESERLVRLLRVRRMARTIFTTDKAVAAWLNEPDSSLGGNAPLEMLRTDIGTAKVENLVRAMMHGIPI